MIYKHGEYAHNVHLVDVSHEPEWQAGGKLRTTSRFLIEGKVEGANQGAVKTAIANLEAAYLGAQQTTSGLYHSDGTTVSGHFLDASVAGSTERGIVARVRWTSDPQRAEYVWYRSFQIEVSATFIGAGASAVRYGNRIGITSDGGPSHGVFPTFDGQRVKQQIFPVSVFTGYETGFKESIVGPVTIQPPTFPDYKRDQMDKGTPTETANGITTYSAYWSYTYESDVEIGV